MNQINFRFAIFLFVIIAFWSCTTNKLPTIFYNQFTYRTSYKLSNDSLKIDIQNPLYCPLRVWISTEDEVLQNRLNKINPILIKSKSDTTIVFSKVDYFDKKIHFSSRFGSIAKKIGNIDLQYPFVKNKSFTVIQGNNDSSSHNTDWSRYAIDFNLKIKDTICSASNGYVVGVVDKYKLNGTNKKWKPFANYITIYEPTSGVFCQYVHLVNNGSFVKVGDQVVIGQKIGLSGNTGFSLGDHLHFNCFVPVNSNDGLKSVPISFYNKIEGKSLKKGDKIKH